ncbi:transposase [Nonomuraea sp. NPDC055795]
MKPATVSRDGKHWFVSFLVDDGLTQVEEHAQPGSAAGVDRGVVSAAVTSDGEFFDRRHVSENGVSCLVPPPDKKIDRGYLTLGEKERYLRLQRRLARMKRRSRRRKAVVAALGDIMRRVRYRRADFNAQTAHRLTQRYGVVVLEDLNTKNMTAAVKPKPDPDWPGGFLPNGQAAKAGLNKAILDKGWYGLEVALLAKARYTGTVIGSVPAPYTSRTCPNPVCRMVDERSRKSQAVFLAQPVGTPSTLTSSGRRTH